MPSKTPSFQEALQSHIESIKNRDLKTFSSNLTNNKILYTIMQDGSAITTPKELVSLHKAWFQDKSWVWDATIVHTVVGEDMALAVIRYEYTAKETFSTYLTYVFKLEQGKWRIIHDQNTAIKD